MKRSNLDKESLVADQKTQIALLTQEKELYKTQINSLKKKNLSLSDTTNYKIRITEMEEEIRNLRKEAKSKDSKAEDVEFVNSQL